MQSFEPDPRLVRRSTVVAAGVCAVVGGVAAVVVGVLLARLDEGAAASGFLVVLATVVLAAGYAVSVVVRAVRVVRTPRRIEVHAVGLRLGRGRTTVDLRWEEIEGVDVVEPPSGRRYPPPGPVLKVLVGPGGPGQGRRPRLETFPLDAIPLDGLRRSLDAASAGRLRPSAPGRAPVVLRATARQVRREAGSGLVMLVATVGLIATMAPVALKGLATPGGPTAVELFPVVLLLGVVWSVVVAVRRLLGAARGELRFDAESVVLSRPGRPDVVIRVAETARLRSVAAVPSRRGARWPVGGTPTALRVDPFPGSGTEAALRSYRGGLLPLPGFDPDEVDAAVLAMRRGGRGGPAAVRVSGRTV